MKRPLKKGNNRGITLLEVIIAVSIFSIAALVLFQGFVTSGRINKKSNLYLEGTSLAQNVMEEIKAKDFEQIALAFNYPVDVSTGLSRFSFLETKKNQFQTASGITFNEVYGTGLEEVKMDGKEGDPQSSTILSEDGGRTYTFNPRTKGDNASKYSFTIKNVTNLHETFNVLVKFDGSVGSGYKSKEPDQLEEEDLKKNDYEAPNITKLDTKNNAYLIEKQVWESDGMEHMIETQFEWAHNKWVVDGENITKTDEEGNKTEEYLQYEKNEPKAFTLEELNEHINRTIILAVQEKNGKKQVSAKYMLNAKEYSKDDNPYETFKECPAADGDEACFCTYMTLGEIAFYGEEADGVLKNIYYFYTPNYLSTDSKKPLDNIIFDNQLNYSVTLNIIKQREADLLPADVEKLKQEEEKYHVSVTIQENPVQGNWFANPNTLRGKTKLRSNLDTNIGFANLKERTDLEQMILKYTDMNKSVSGQSAKRIVEFNGLENKAAKDRIYKVTVEVYKAEDPNNPFDEKNLVATLEGSKED